MRDVRVFEGMGPEPLGRLLSGPGVPRDLGDKVWSLIHGVDDTEVAKAKEVPQQISIVSRGQCHFIRSFLISWAGRQLRQAR